MLIKCPCNVCATHLEFEEALTGANITCPTCGMDTLLFVPSVSLDAPSTTPTPALLQLPKPSLLPPAQPVWFGKESSRVHIQLTSGALLEIASVRLYNAATLQALSGERAIAAQKLAGVSTGLSAWGSLSWVILASAAIGTVENALSDIAAKDGIARAQQIWHWERQLRLDGLFFLVGMIDEIDSPSPDRWNVPSQPCYPYAFIHSGADFVTVQDTEGRIKEIRWSAVASYNYSVNGEDQGNLEGERPPA